MVKKYLNFFLLKLVGALCAGALLYLAFDASLLSPLSVVSFLILILILKNTPKALERCIMLSAFVVTFVFLQFSFLWDLARIEGWEDLLINVVISVFYLIPLYAVSFIRSKNYVELTLAGWLISEYLFSYIPTGNQLFQMGIIVANFPFAIQWYEFTGIYWGSFWLILISYLCFRAFFSRKFIIILVFSIIAPPLVSLVVYPRSDQAANSRRIAIVPLAKNEDADSMFRRLESFNLSEVDYVLFPEGALGLYEKAVMVSPTMTSLRRLAERYENVSIFLGLFTHSNTSWDNSIFIFSSNDTLQRYKTLKVPFCEYLPCPDLLERFDFIKNNVKYPLKDRTNHSEFFIRTQDTIAPLICYEGLSTKFVCKLARQGANIFFVSSSNTYIKSDHIEHINQNIIQANAILTRRSFVRCVEHGHSSFIRSDGCVDWESVQNTQITIHHASLNSIQTFYVKNASIIDNIYIILLIAFVIVFGNSDLNLTRINS